MTYIISIISPPEREALIRKAVLASSKKEDFYAFRSTRNELPVIRIPLGLVMYRIENFRTFTDQKEYISNEGKTADYFSKGQEVESVQQIQHSILASLANKGKDASLIPVIEVLARERQREPLLITSAGIVVNGNRRLAAMRELYYQNSEVNSSFSHIDAMVLPSDANEEEIIDIEASLQAKPETKMDYDWIGDAQLLKSQVMIHKTIAAVAKRLDRSEKEIKNSIAALAEADLYLKDWAKAEGHYSLVKEDGKQLFSDLPKRIEDKDSQLENASRAIAWTLFDNRDKLSGRIYDYNVAFGKLASDVLDRVSDKLGIPTTLSSSSLKSSDDFLVDIGEDEESTSYDSLIDIFRQKNGDAVNYLIDSCLEAIETQKGQQSGLAALKAIAAAHSKLVSIELDKADENSYSTIGKQLEAIAVITTKLKEKLDKLISSLE